MDRQPEEAGRALARAERLAPPSNGPHDGPVLNASPLQDVAVPPADERSVLAILAADAQAGDAVADVHAAAKPKSVWSSLRPGEWLGLARNFFTERWFARRRSRALLEAYERVRSTEAQLRGKELYTRVLIECGCEPKVAARVLLRAEQTFCEWPTEHDLRFQDVVRYLVVSEYLCTHIASFGTHTNMGRVVARLIPDVL